MKSAAPWEGGAESSGRHARLVAHVGETRLALALPPHSGSSGDSSTDNPTSLFLLLSPVVSDEQTIAIVEILQRPTGAPAASEGYLRFLSAVCELAADDDRHRQLQALRERATARGQFDSFTQHVHSSLETRRVAFTLANEGRALIGCDRTSVALVHGRKARLLSISGVDTLNRRAASVRDLESLIAAVVAVDEPLWYPQDAALLPPQIEQVLHAYLDQSHARQLAVVPLREPVVEGPDSTPAAVIGALVCEHFTSSGDVEQTKAQTLAVAAQGTVALANALEYEGVPLVRLWRALGQSRRLVRGRQLPKTLLALVAVAALVAALLYVQIDFTVAGRGASCPSAVVTCSPPSTA